MTIGIGIIGLNNAVVCSDSRVMNPFTRNNGVIDQNSLSILSDNFDKTFKVNNTIGVVAGDMIIAGLNTPKFIQNLIQTNQFNIQGSAYLLANLCDDIAFSLNQNQTLHDDKILNLILIQTIGDNFPKFELNRIIFAPVINGISYSIDSNMNSNILKFGYYHWDIIGDKEAYKAARTELIKGLEGRQMSNPRDLKRLLEKAIQNGIRKSSYFHNSKNRSCGGGFNLKSLM